MTTEIEGKLTPSPSAYSSEDSFCTATTHDARCATTHPHVSRRCERVDHANCSGGWSQYPDAYGDCRCDCHTATETEPDLPDEDAELGEHMGEHYRGECRCDVFRSEKHDVCSAYVQAESPQIRRQEDVGVTLTRDAYERGVWQ